MNNFRNLENFSIVDVLLKKSIEQQNDLAFKFITETNVYQITYRELATRVVSVGTWLQEHKAQKQRAIIFLPSGLDYIVAFLGCLYAGVIAVPAYPPRNSRYMERIQSIIDDANPQFIITSKDIRELHTFNKIILIINELENDFQKSWNKTPISMNDLAFLQYTSGSTGHPKGVMITHDNIIKNVQIMQKNILTCPQFNIGCSWLPPYHDMGLIGGILFPLYSGFPTILMSPHYFLQQPIRWLEIISSEKVTLSPAPNFAYDLCVQAIKEEQLVQLDLSSWKTAYNGAEPISANTINAFNQTFNQCGLSLSTISPCYGMAETTLMVTITDILSEATVKVIEKAAFEEGRIVSCYKENFDVSKNLQLVGCGYSDSSYDLVIVNPSTYELCSNNIVGEIWINGPSVAKGYWNKPKLTKEIFHVKLPQNNKEYLRTGDLGFLDENNQLFVTGRLKDLIIFQGRNIYPQDIESTVYLSHPDLINHCCVAFSINLMNREQLIIIQEVKRHVKDYDIIFESILKQLLEEHDIVPFKVILIRQASLPKTSSGKVQRSYCSQLLQKDKLIILAKWEQTVLEMHNEDTAPRDEIEKQLVGILSEVLGLPEDKVGIYDNFFQLGGHSLKATQVVARIRSCYQIDLPLRSLFEHPTIDTISRLIKEAIGQEQQSLPSLSKQIREEVIPLSFAQQRLWFLDQLIENKAVYNIPVALRLKGRLDIVALENSLKKIVERHESLRTYFKVIEGEAQQLVANNVSLSLQQYDLSKVDKKKEKEQQIISIAKAEAIEMFDLNRAPLIRIKLLILGSTEHVVLITMHHIISDGWSMGILVQEVSKLYNHYAYGKSLDLDELPVQYVDYAIWQRGWLKGGILKEQLLYWQEKLQDIPEALNLPFDKVRPMVSSYVGKTYNKRINKELVSGLQKIGEEKKVTLYMTLLAVVQVLLYRYSNQEDIVIGSPIAGRRHKEIEGLIGFFVNTLVLRSNLRDNPRFTKLLQMVRESVLEAYAHQDIPFEQLVDHLKVSRDLGRHPIFQVMLALQNTNREQLGLEKLKAELLTIDNQRVKFDMFFNVKETDNEELLVSIEYASDLFYDETIERMGNHLEQLIESIIQDSEQHIDEINLLTDKEKHQLLIEWNDTDRDYPKDKTIHQLFEEQVEKTPDNIAVVCEEKQLSYRELNEKANQLAHYLVEHACVKTDTLVALCLDRSEHVLISMIAILKAGGAYVPIDVDYPNERLQFILEDVQAPVLITHSTLQNRCNNYSGKIVCIDYIYKILRQQSTHNLKHTALSDSLIYIIYTSGTTGIPKGVVIEHRSVIRLIKDTNYIKITHNDCIVQASNISFDAATFEIWGALVNGATLLCIAKDILLDEECFTHILKNYPVTILWLTAEVFRNYAFSRPNIFKKLKYLLVGGDVLYTEAVDKIVNDIACKPQFFYNGYGPTENTTFTTIYCISNKIKGLKSIPIGKPISNTKIYILNKGLSLAPIGVTGEVYVGGIGLARGYFNRSELTTRKFINNLFATAEDYAKGLTKLYKTGDLARYLPDGNIEYIGRIDNQVKIRGYRIELEEIESTIRKHESIKDVMVIVRDNNLGDKRLIAYIICNKKEVFSKEIQDLSSENIKNWQTIYSDLYSQIGEATNLKFNTTGWNSSYTTEKIPDKEMKEWVDYTVERILSLNPNQVLEIGCGTGLLLSRIAPYCSEYLATDFSTQALEYINLIKTSSKELNHVTLLNKWADNFEGIPKAHYDTVILNSIIQYFPNVDYLVSVLKQAIEVVKPGGYIFIGDIRNYKLIKAYYASITIFKSPNSASVQQIKQQIDNLLSKEEELVIDPELFTILQAEFPQISNIQIQLKRGKYYNELTKFRYDVILKIGNNIQLQKVEWINWHHKKNSLSSIRQVLSKQKPTCIGIKNIYNERLSYEITALKLLQENNSITTIQNLNKLSQDKIIGINPEDLYKLGEEFSYFVETNIKGISSENIFDVVFIDKLKINTQHMLIDFARNTKSKKDYSNLNNYTNTPLITSFTQKLTTKLQEYIHTILPEYMIPKDYVFLEKFPLTPNGKIDHKALPILDSNVRNIDSIYTAPRDEIEKQLVGILSEVLGLPEDKVGIYDNFFQLGGHSLKATQVVARIRSCYQIDLPLRSLFEHPTIDTISRLIKEAIGQEQQSLPSLSKQIREEVIPLSFAQQRLWFLDQLIENKAVYNIPVALRLKGRLDIVALENSLKKIVERHESLRTYFKVIEGEAQQLVANNVSLSLQQYDLSKVDKKKEKEQQIISIAKAEAIEMFDLNRAPLIRIKLLILGSTEHVVLITMHHIISDGWSMGILVQEVSKLYNHYAYGKSLDLDELPVQYVDYAIWQRGWLKGGILKEQLLYWQEKLQDIPEALNLPFDKVRPMVSSYVGKTYNKRINKELVSGLQKIGEEKKVTLYMTLLAVVQVLLYRYSNQEDIVIGSPIAGRRHKEIEGLIGFFVNTLVLRSNLRDNPRFTKLLQMVRESVLEAYAHQDIPFEQLVDHLKVSRDLGRHPIFQVMLALQNTNREQLGLEKLKAELLTIDNNQSKFDLTFNISEERSSGELLVSIEYASDLFYDETIERMGNHLEQLIESIIQDSEQHIDALNLLTDKERHQLLIEWNDTDRDYPKDKTIHQLFEEQVERTPDSIAVVYEEQHLSYRELNEKANQLAHYLRRIYGVQENNLVALYLDRSEYMLIAILAVLKSGGAYVPLDPGYPNERNQFILEDTNTSIVLTNQIYEEKLCILIQSTVIKQDSTDKLEKQLEQKEQLVILAIDSIKIASRLLEESLDNSIAITSSTNLAYIIYTSGTTGKPKGVILEHRGVVNRINWMNEAYPLTQSDRILQKTPYVFDVSVWELIWASWYGATIVFTTPGMHKDAEVIKNLFIKENITIAHFVPSMLLLFEDTLVKTNKLLNYQLLNKLRFIFCSGEELRMEMVRRCHELLPSVELYNLYGPTETSIDVLYHNCNNKKDEVVSIGKPISNSKAYVLDKNLYLVHIGAVGELYIGGIGLARGYLNRPDLTGERFIPNPFQSDREKQDISYGKNGRNARLYKTGDLVRWLPDGSLEYIGRNDFQVKIRGYRIELGEIESVLSQYPGITQSVVIAKEHNIRIDSNNKYLVGYYTSDKKLNEEFILTYLKSKLPEYMIPSILVYIEKLPLTHNGKLDRNALPDPEFIGDQDNYVAPKTELEKKVCSIWSEVLGLPEDKVGIHNDFFRLGGNSILAIKLASKLNKELNNSTSVSSIFKYNTVDKLIHYLDLDLNVKIEEGNEYEF